MATKRKSKKTSTKTSEAKTKSAKPVKGGKRTSSATSNKDGKSSGKMSGLDAAAKVLAEQGESMTVKQITEAIFAKGYWSSGGQTPSQSIAAAIGRELNTKGKQSRFKRTQRGKFRATGRK